MQILRHNAIDNIYPGVVAAIGSPSPAAAPISQLLCVAAKKSGLSPSPENLPALLEMLERITYDKLMWASERPGP